jgi:uncharacterized protein (TIGR00290 family)
MSKINCYMNWSGGKDCALCLYDILQSSTYNVRYLLTSVNAVHDRISMHGVRRSLLIAQARMLGIELRTIELPEQPGMEEYETAMRNAASTLKEAGCTHSIFGDIFLEDLRTYREQKLRELELQCVFPLWKRNTALLVKRFIEEGFKSIIVCVNDKYLDRSFVGRVIDETFLNDLPAGVDPCGENGEFHSFVFDAPHFRQPIEFEIGQVVYRTYRAPEQSDDCYKKADKASAGFYFQDIILTNNES